MHWYSWPISNALSVTFVLRLLINVMDIVDWCINQLVRSIPPLVELLSIDPLMGKYPCPVDYCKSTFERSDKLQCHFKVQHAERNNSALNQNLNDTLQKAMSLGMLIQPPVEQTPELLRDVGLVVLNIMDGIRLLLCKVCNVCLEPKPCQVHTHLLGHDNRRAPKRHRNGR